MAEDALVPAGVHERPIPVAVVDGIPVDDVTLDETVRLIEAFVRESRSTGRSFQIATVNADFLTKASRDERLRAVLRDADLCLPDGMPVVWLSRLGGTKLRERVAGADLVPALVERIRTTDTRILLFGSAPGVAEKAAQLLKRRSPGASVFGMSGSAMGPELTMNPATVDAVRAMHADVICVALGNPKQEFWIEGHRHLIGPAVLIGVGGTLDFLVGGRRRAPGWMQRFGLEWVFRAAQEPARLGRRYLDDCMWFVPRLVSAVVSRLSGSGRRGSGLQHASVRIDDGSAAIDLSGVDEPSPRDLEWVVAQIRHARRWGRQSVLHGASPAFRAALTAFESSTGFSYDNGRDAGNIG